MDDEDDAPASTFSIGYADPVETAALHAFLDEHPDGGWFTSPVTGERSYAIRARSGALTPTEPQEPPCDRCGIVHAQPDYGTGDGCSQW